MLCINALLIQDGSPMSPLDDFARSLDRPDLASWLRGGLIGDGVEIDGPYGPKPLIYADYVASGRALAQVEDFIRANQSVLCPAYTKAVHRLN